MHKYECVFRGSNGNRWTVMINAESFTEAEKLVMAQADLQMDDELIEIKKDYDATTGS